MGNKKTILLVEDSLLVQEVIKDLLLKNGYQLKTAVSGEETLRMLKEGFLPDLILMDIGLSGEIDGIETLKKINQKWDIPVVFLTSNTSEEIISKIKKVNAYGFVLKGSDKAPLLSTVDMALRLHRESSRAKMFQQLFETSSLEKQKAIDKMLMIIEGIPNPTWLISRERKILAQNKVASTLFDTKVGDYCWQSIHGVKVLDKESLKIFQEKSLVPSGAKCYFCRGDEALDKKISINDLIEIDGSFWDTWWIPLEEDVYLHYAMDVTKYKKMEEQLVQLAITDYLTGSYSRRYFIQELEKEMARAKRTGSKFSIILLDIDHFKSINDRFGHNLGDLVLKNITKLIKDRIRKTDILARWGGEEFVILLPDTTVKNGVVLAEELRQSISEMKLEDGCVVTASFGVVEYCEKDSVDSLINKADKMMYEAKAAGRNCVKYLEQYKMGNNG